MDYKQHKGNLRGQIKNKVERKLYNKQRRAEAIDVDTSERQLAIPDVSVAKRKLCPTCGCDSLITLSDITYCMNDCCDGIKGHN